MSSVQALFSRFSWMDLEMATDHEIETDLEMIGFYLEIQCLHS